MLRLVIVSPSGELSRTTAAKVSFPGAADSPCCRATLRSFRVLRRARSSMPNPTGAKNTASALRADSSACCAMKLKRALR